MNEQDIIQYNKNVATIKICLDVVASKLLKREDPARIEKIVKGIEHLILKCYNMNPGPEKKDELTKMHEINLSIFDLLKIAKSYGWELLEFE